MDRIECALTEYKGWPHCIRLTSGGVSAVLTTDIGPRIIHYGIGGMNMLYEDASTLGQMAGDDWRIYGGHRLWHGPQVGFRPNEPDNSPVEYAIEGQTVRLTQRVEPIGKLLKRMTITMGEGGALSIVHEMENRHVWPVRLALWALTAMAPGGIEVLPLSSRDTEFLPNYLLAFWPWTLPNDHRFELHARHMTLRQDPQDGHWFKVAHLNTDGWGAYFNRNMAFVKRVALVDGAEYPDFGCNFATYTDAKFLEMESQGPLVTLDPGECTRHVEHWNLFGGVEIPTSAQAAIELSSRLATELVGVSERH